MPDLQTFCGNNDCREMFKPAVSKKNPNAILTSAQKIHLIVCRKFQNFSEKKEKKKECISLHVLTYMPRVINVLLIEKRITNCSLQTHFMKFHENW